MEPKIRLTGGNSYFSYYWIWRKHREVGNDEDKVRWNYYHGEKREKRYDRNMLHPPLSPIVGSSTACLHAAAAIYQWRMHAGDDDERRERPGSDDECSSSSSSLAKW